MSVCGAVGLSGLCQVTDHLYLSSGRAARDPAQISGRNITCIIGVTESEDRFAPPAGAGVDYIHIPLPDTPVSPIFDHFDRVSDVIQRISESGGRTLVHCNAGVSRSAALCIAFLMKHRGLSLLEAHGSVKTCRPIVRPNSGFWKQLIRYELELRGSNSVRMVSSCIGEIPDIYEEQTENLMPL